MSTLTPIGDRVFVTLEQPIDEVTERARRVGLHAVVLEHNKPKPTTGIVVAVGSGPEIQQQVKVGDRVYFSRHAGSEILTEGQSYWVLELFEIISVERFSQSPQKGE